MGYIMHGLTAVLVVLKVLGEIDWSWWYVLMPSLLYYGFIFALAVCVIIGLGKDLIKLTHKK